MRRYGCLSLIAAILFAGPAGAVDLQKIKRTLRKEPVYQSKNPLYCLLVFGPEANTQVWLVLDDDVLYLDRNGNGDLTDPGERIVPQKVLHRAEIQPDVEVMRTFQLSRPKPDPWETDAAPILSCGPDVTWFYVNQLIPREDCPNRDWAKFWQDKPFDVAVNTATSQRARVRFAERPHDAPILHFDGPRSLALSDKFGSFELRRGETSYLVVELTTPGLNAEVRLDHFQIPPEVHPVAEIEFAAGRTDGDPIRLRVELQERC